MVQRLFDIPFHQLERYPQETAIACKENGEWRRYSTQQLIDAAQRTALGLIALGIAPGDKVAVASGNRSEWCIVDQAILMIGAINVPIYPTSSTEDYGFVLDHCGARICFCANKDILEKAQQAKEAAPALTHLFTFDRLEGVPHWEEVPAMAREEDRPLLLELGKKVDSGDLATIIYTSGTTGKPKGVMLTHDNLLSNVHASMTRFPVDHSAVAISFLPLSHVYERMLMYLYMYSGVSIHFQESLEDLGDRIREVRPHVFTAVPRLLEKIYDRIMSKGEALTGIKRALFFWSISLGERYDVHGRGFLYDLQLSIARKLIFSKWQEALGGNVRVVASGSAALQERLARVFNAAGVPVMEGYGLTESSPVISVNDARNDGLRFGTVGRPIPGVEVRIASDGEILARGPNIMQGYYMEPEQTRQALDEEGWLHTGDIGEIDGDGFLKITDRKKEMFKTSGGKYVAPQVLENKLKSSRFVEQVMVIGEGRKFPAALIVPSFDFLADYCRIKGIPFHDREQVCADDRIKERIMREVTKANEGRGNWETIKKIHLLSEDWTIEGGELTPTLKLRRKPILAKYADVVEALYGNT